MTIYLDIIFLINLAADFTLNFTCTILAERKTSFKKIFLISLAGALYGSCSILFPFLEKRFIAFIYSCFNIFLLFGKSTKDEFIRHMAMYYFVCVLTGGVCCFFSQEKNTALLHSGKIFIVANDVSIFSSLFIVCIISKLIKTITKYKRLHYKVTLKTKKTSVQCTSYYDTGNMLTEPLTGKPVIIISKKIADILGCEKEGIVKYNTISENNKYLDLIKIDELIFYEDNYVMKNIYCGIAEQENTRFDVILHRETYPLIKKKGLVKNCSV